MTILNALKLSINISENVIVFCSNYIKKIVRGFLLKTIMSFAGLIYLFSWGFLGFSILELLIEIESWDKSGHWVTETIYSSFMHAGKPLSLFSMPNHPGIQNLLNGILFSSFPIFCFIMFILFQLIAFLIAEYIPD